MRLAPLLAALIALSACAHAPALPDDSAGAWAAVEHELAYLPACIAIPGQSIPRTQSAITLPAVTGADGVARFRSDQRTALGAFASIGFLQPEEQRDGAGRVTALRYAVTAAGAPYFHFLLPEPAGTRSTGFCTGRRVLVERIVMTPTHRDHCATSRRTRFTWRYEALAGWLDAAPIAAAFSERVRPADAGRVRPGEMPLLLFPEGWVPGAFDYIHQSCGPPVEVRLYRT